MRGELTVRINDGERDRHVTGAVRDLRFRKTAPGGHHSASMRLVLPRGTFRDLGPADKIYVYDASTARTIWEGYIENPGTTDGPQGEEYDLSAMGGMVLASDESRALVYVDSKFDQWKRHNYPGTAASATSEATSNPTTGDDGLVVQFIPGQPVATDSLVRMKYDLSPLGMEVGAFKITHQSGQTDANYEDRVEVGPPTVFWNGGQSTTAATLTKYATTDGFAGANYVVVQLRRLGGATNVATDNVWNSYTKVKIIGQHMTPSGGRLVHAVADYTLASVVAGDLLARVLTSCDSTTAKIDGTSYQIDQLAYWDGATAAQVLDDLSLYEPDMLWEILESVSNGKHRFNYRKWPTTPRYEISVKDGYSAPGGESDLCNRITVYWTDPRGRRQATVVTQTVPELGSRIRDADAITLPDGVGSAANATRIGQQVLASKAKPPKAATAVVRRTIVDHLTNTTVMPWEIEPGYLVRVRETGDDLRLTEVEYVDNDGAASLTLGEPTLTIEQRIARLSNRR